MTSPTLEHIPNWQRFVEMYHPDDELIDAFIHRIESITDTDIQERIFQYINLELGILLLAHHEIDSRKMREILLITGGENT